MSYMNWLNPQEIWSVYRKVDWDNTDFNILKAYFLSLFSTLVYYKITEIDYSEYRRATVVPCFAFQRFVVEKEFDFEEFVRRMDIELIDVFTCDYFVIITLRVGEITIIAIRGTGPFYDWRINLNLRKFNFEGGMFHRGFFRETVAHVRLFVEKNVLHQGKVYITGHSLGGAVSAILGIFASSDGQCDLKSIYTFGTPRCGDNEYFRRKVDPFVIVRRGDPVPDIPPERFGFRDPKFLLAPDGGVAEFERGRSEWSFIKFNVNNRLYRFFPEHAMENYLGDLNAAARELGGL